MLKKGSAKVRGKELISVPIRFERERRCQAQLNRCINVSQRPTGVLERGGYNFVELVGILNGSTDYNREMVANVFKCVDTN